jgi:TatD DNase family protein
MTQPPTIVNIEKPETRIDTRGLRLLCVSMLIDAHAHLDKYGEDLPVALEEIERHGIFSWAVSMDLPSYRRNLEIGEMSALVLPTFGVHPRRAPEYAGHLADLSSWIERSPAIGEIGLDFYWIEDSSQYAAQRKVVEYFLAAAREQNKIVNLHTKGAEKEVLDLLVRYEVKRAVVHWYSGPLDILGAFVDYGADFTVGVEILTSEKIRQIARAVPLWQILTETDNPGGHQWLNGTMGMPSIVLDVVEEIAAVKKTTPEAVAQAVEENFRRLIDGDAQIAKFF